jgi:hypothetical protein
MLSCGFRVLKSDSRTGRDISTTVVELDRPYRFHLTLRSRYVTTLSGVNVILKGPYSKVVNDGMSRIGTWSWGVYEVGPFRPFEITVPFWVPVTCPPTFKSKKIEFDWWFEVAAYYDRVRFSTTQPCWYHPITVVPKKVYVGGTAGHMPWGRWRERAPVADEDRDTIAIINKLLSD